jgi:anti-anti-sigma factor
MSTEWAERRVGPVTVLTLKGRMAFEEGSRRLDEKLQSLINEGRVNLLLECSEVEALDSQGISALVRALITTGRLGGKVKLLRPSARVRHVLEVTRLLSVLEAFEDEKKALGSF